MGTDSELCVPLIVVVPVNIITCTLLVKVTSGFVVLENFSLLLSIVHTIPCRLA